jgi:S1-C subfamily serine protease
MPRLFLVIISLVSSFSIFAQSSATVVRSAILPIENLREMVVQLCRTTDTNHNIMLTGTGFFVLHNDNLYLVTATHVSRNMDSKAYVIGHAYDDHPVKLSIIDIDTTGQINWKNHTLADLSVLKVNATAKIYNELLAIAFSSSAFAKTLAAPNERTELTLVGFPLGLGSSGRFSGFTKRTRPASGLFSFPRADNNELSTFFALEDPIAQGYSGGPVFDVSVYNEGMITMTGRGTVCWGIAHATLYDNTGGKMGAVTPSYYLFDLIF